MMKKRRIYRYIVFCLLIILASFSCWIYIKDYLSRPSLAKYSPPLTEIINIKFPRIGLPIYRGLSSSEFSVTDSIAAMLGNNEKLIKSKLMKIIESKCTEKTDLAISDIDLISGLVNSINCSEIKESLQNFSLEKSYNGFNEISKRKDFEKLYLNYRYKNYQDYPSLFIFGSIYSWVASIYGDNIVIFKDHKYFPRSLDLNYYNYFHTGRWLQKITENDNRDKGEFIMPIAVFSNEIIGYEIREKFKSKCVGKGIVLGFYKSIINSQTVVIVVDGQSESQDCIDSILVKDNIIKYAQNQRELNRTVKINGIISFCEGQQCSYQNEELRKNYRCSNKELDRELVKQISQISVNAKSIKFIPCNNSKQF